MVYDGNWMISGIGHVIPFALSFSKENHYYDKDSPELP